MGVYFYISTAIVKSRPKARVTLVVIVIVIVIALCLQYVLKGYPRKFLELLTGTPPHLTLNQVSYHSAESTEEIA